MKEYPIYLKVPTNLDEAFFELEKRIFFTPQMSYFDLVYEVVSEYYNYATKDLTPPGKDFEEFVQEDYPINPRSIN